MTFSLPHLAVLTVSFVFIVAVLRMAWVSDDAFITIRSVDNLFRGEGLLLNADQRVQSYTSPLWMLLCLPMFALTGSPYGALMVAGVTCSLLLTVIIVRGLRANAWGALAVLAVLSASTSFLSYSTSGLENPLAHVLVALFCLERMKQGLKPTAALFFLAGGLFLTRFDYAVLVAPSILAALWVDYRRALRLAALPLGLVLAWFAFATVYYGFPLPNTAYAKLNTGISLSSRALQGLAYLADTAVRDPITWVVLGLAGSMCVQRGVAASARVVLLGVLLYLAYIINIGGDFMSGRFLTTCLLAAALVAAHLSRSLPLPATPVFAGACLLVTLAAFADRQADKPHGPCHVPETGIVDERECYVEHTALTANLRVQKWKSHPYLRDFARARAKAKDDVIVWNVIGMAPYGTDRQAHIVEEYALSEPLLARIRLAPGQNWRPGHFHRPAPEGYLESLRTGENRLKNPCLRGLHERLQLATSGPLWSVERFRAIWELNTTHRTCAAPR